MHNRSSLVLNSRLQIYSRASLVLNSWSVNAQQIIPGFNIRCTQFVSMLKISDVCVFCTWNLAVQKDSGFELKPTFSCFMILNIFFIHIYHKNLSHMYIYVFILYRYIVTYTLNVFIVYTVDILSHNYTLMYSFYIVVLLHHKGH